MGWLRLGEGHTMTAENAWFSTPLPHHLAKDQSPPDPRFGTPKYDLSQMTDSCKYCHEKNLKWTKGMKDGVTVSKLVDRMGTQHDCRSTQPRRRR